MHRQNFIIILILIIVANYNIPMTVKTNYNYTTIFISEIHSDPEPKHVLIDLVKRLGIQTVCLEMSGSLEGKRRTLEKDISFATGLSKRIPKGLTKEEITSFFRGGGCTEEEAFLFPLFVQRLPGLKAHYEMLNQLAELKVEVIGIDDRGGSVRQMLNASPDEREAIAKRRDEKMLTDLLAQRIEGKSCVVLTGAYHTLSLTQGFVDRGLQEERDFLCLFPTSKSEVDTDLIRTPEERAIFIDTVVRRILEIGSD